MSAVAGAPNPPPPPPHAALPGPHSFLIDGEAIVTNERGLAGFDPHPPAPYCADALLIAFDLVELDGEDLRRTPIEYRKRTLAKLVRRPHAGIVLKGPAVRGVDGRAHPTERAAVVTANARSVAVSCV